MPSHRSQAQFQRSQWRLLILLPFWGFQLALALTMAGLFSWRLGDTLHFYGDKKHGRPSQLELVWESTSIAFSAVGAICTVVEIARYLAEALTPWTMLFTHTIKLTCASVMLALDVVVHVKGFDEHYSAVGLGLDALLLLTALSLFAYTIHVFRRSHAFDDNAHTVNVKAYGFNDDMHYDPSYSGNKMEDIIPAVERRVSSASARLSFASTRSFEKTEPTKHQRTPSYYSHQRDTQFEEYLARRKSTDSRADVERARSASLGSTANFGWSSPSPSLENKGLEEQLGRPRGLSAPRAPSWTSDHVLVAVPEEDEAMREELDRQTLLHHEHNDNVSEEIRMPQEVDLADTKR